MENKAKIERDLEESSNLIRDVKQLSPKIAKAVEIIADSFRSGYKVIAAGNGGSAADAQHITGELICTYAKNRSALPAICLHGDASALTAWANDKSYDFIFERGIEAHGRKGDIFIPISTSGNSKNLIHAAKKANELGLITIGLLGRGGGELRKYCNYDIIIPHQNTGRIQEAQHVVYHIICELVEKELFENRPVSF